MSITGPHLLGLLLTASLAAQEAPAPAAPVKTSARLAQEIRTALPKYTPPPARPDPILTPAPESLDASLLVLPKVTVKEKLPPTHDPDVWLTRGAIGQKAMVAYKQSMTDLEWALNSWFIPLVTPPASVRARSAYQGNKFRQEVIRLNTLMDRIATEDPQAAAELKQELKNLVEGRPAGAK